MGKKLFIGNLAWATDDFTLRKAFEEFGEVAEAKVIFDRETGRSRGFGFVSYGSEEEATKAKEGMNGKELDGKELRVDLANARAPREVGESKPGGFRARRDGP